MLARLVSNSWPQVICLHWPPKVLRWKVWTTVPGQLQEDFTHGRRQRGSRCVTWWQSKCEMPHSFKQPALIWPNTAKITHYCRRAPSHSGGIQFCDPNTFHQAPPPILGIIFQHENWRGHTLKLYKSFIRGLWSIYKSLYRLGRVPPTCSIHYFRGWGRRIAWAQECKSSLGNLARLKILEGKKPLSFLTCKISGFNEKVCENLFSSTISLCLVFIFWSFL